MAFLLLLGWVGSSAFAIGYRELRGVHARINALHEVYSPLLGYALSETESLNSYRKFGNFGKKIARHGCMDLVPNYHDTLIARNDCPQDYSSEWIQRTFPAHDGNVITENNNTVDPISALDGFVAGRILQRVARQTDISFSNSTERAELFEDINRILIEELHPASLKKKLTVARQEKKQLEDARASSNNKLGQFKRNLRQHAVPDEAQGILLGKIQNLESEIVKFDLNLPRIERRVQFLTRFKAAKWNLDELSSIANIFVNALRESRGNHASYPRYFPEHLLLAFLLRSFDTKDVFIDLFRGMPELLNDNLILEDEATQEAFLASRWENEDRFDLSRLDPQEIAREFLQFPELFIFEAFKQKESFFPILVKTKILTPRSGQSQGDCGESLVRNLFNFVVFNDTGNFSINKLRQLELAHPELKINQRLFDFYERNSSSSDAVKAEVHLDWLENVASRLKVVQYLKGNGKYDINSGVDNFLRTMEQLLFSRGDGPETILTDATRTRAERLDELFRLLSVAGRTFHWSYHNIQSNDRQTSHQRVNQRDYGTRDAGNDYQLDLRIGANYKAAENDDPTITLRFWNIHFDALGVKQPVEGWKKFEILKEIIDLPILKEHPALAGLLPLLIDSSTFDALPNARRTVEDYAALHFEGMTAEQRVSVLKEMMTKGRSMNPISMGLKKKLIAELPIEKQAEIYKSERQNGYPLDITHPLGKSGSLLRRMPPEQVESEFGREGADKMGETWIVEVNGRKVAVGQTLLDQSGEPLEVRSLDEAKRQCNELSPIGKRATASRILDEINLELMRIAHSKTTSEEKENAFSEFIASKSIDGCWLPTAQEILTLAGLFYYPENKPENQPKYQGVVGHLRFVGSRLWFGRPTEPHQQVHIPHVFIEKHRPASFLNPNDLIYLWTSTSRIENGWFGRKYAKALAVSIESQAGIEIDAESPPLLGPPPGETSFTALWRVFSYRVRCFCSVQDL